MQRVTVNDQATFELLEDFAQQQLPHWADKNIIQYSDADLFAELGLEAQIQQALEPEYTLPSGAELVFEQTKALVSVDVNSKSFLGSQGGAASMEDTALQVNLEAARMIPTQLRLRNLGGLVVIDFIDMQQPEHQQQVLAALKEAFVTDPSQVRVEDFSEHGTVQLSRKRNRQSLGQLMQAGAAGDAAVEAACAAITQALVKQARSRQGSANNEFLVRADQAVVDRLLSDNGKLLNEVRAKIPGGIGVQAEPDFATGQFDISLVQGPVS
jgi:ribonuclease G